MEIPRTLNEQRDEQVRLFYSLRCTPIGPEYGAGIKNKELKGPGIVSVSTSYQSRLKEKSAYLLPINGLGSSLL